MVHTHNQMRATLSIAVIFAFRMLGLFMLIPVFTVYANKLSGASPFLIGLALGIYGLTQGVLQIPLGYLSDKYGRKKVITFGLSLFALGSLLAYLSHNIWLVIIARGLQGAGAIGSTLIALISDLTDESQRTKAMAMLGGVIGLSFSVAMVLGPIIASHYDLDGIFLFTLLLALTGIAILHMVVPNPATTSSLSGQKLSLDLLKKVLKNHDIKRLNAGIFLQHAIFTATFFVIPIVVKKTISVSWHFYLPVVVISFIIAVPAIIYAEKRQQLRKVFLSSIGLILLSETILGASSNNINALFNHIFPLLYRI
jgi:MFS family permease